MAYIPFSAHQTHVLNGSHASFPAMETVDHESVSTVKAAEITRHLEGLGGRLKHATSPSVCRALDTSWQDLRAGRTAPSRQWAQVALDYSWEQLNMGNWEDVSVVWREVYATAALLKALALLREGESQKALEELDRGILLGAPILDSALHSLAASLTTKSHMNYDDSTTAASCSRAEESVVSDCRPGAKGGRKKIIFRNYKPLRDSEETVYSDETKRPRMGVDVHDLASRTANVPVVDQEHRIPLTYLPSLETFRLKYMLTKTPVVISGAMDTWPAYSARKWR